MEEQLALDLGPEADTDRGRFPTVQWWADRKAEDRQQLSLFPVQAVTAPTGWETYQRFRAMYRTPTRQQVLRRESYLAQLANCPPMTPPPPVSGEGSR